MLEEKKCQIIEYSANMRVKKDVWEDRELFRFTSLCRHLFRNRWKKKKETLTSTAFCQYKQAKAHEDIVNEFKSIASLPDVFNWIICTEVKDFHFYND